MPVTRVPGQPFGASVGQADGRRGRFSHTPPNGFAVEAAGLAALVGRAPAFLAEDMR